jgi:hypothetical protein
MILKTIRMGRPRSGRLPFLSFGFCGKGNRNGRGGGNVEIRRGWPDFQGTVERGGNLGLVFHAFHGPAISTALSRSSYRNRGGGSGDSILQAHSSLALAALILLANSVSLLVLESRSNPSRRIPSLR